MLKCPQCFKENLFLSRVIISNVPEYTMDDIEPSRIIEERLEIFLCKDCNNVKVEITSEREL